MAAAADIARYLIYLGDQEAEPANLTHMQLHKLLYYVQGWSLGTHGQPLFSDDIEAWQHGPVVRSLYPVFADFGSGRISASEGNRGAGLEESERAIVRSVWEHYKAYSAPQLRRMTHAEAPWRETRGDLPEDAPCSEVISQDRLRSFFRELAESRAAPGLSPTELEQAERDFEQGRSVKLRDLINGWRDAV